MKLNLLTLVLILGLTSVAQAETGAAVATVPATDIVATTATIENYSFADKQKFQEDAFVEIVKIKESVAASTELDAHKEAITKAEQALEMNIEKILTTEEAQWEEMKKVINEQFQSLNNLISNKKIV